MKAKDGNTNKKRTYEEVCWSLSHSSLAVHCVGVSVFHFPIVSVLGIIAITTTHCTVHHHATYPYHVNGTDMVDRSVGWSVSRSMHVFPYTILVWGSLRLTPIRSECKLLNTL